MDTSLKQIASFVAYLSLNGVWALQFRNYAKNKCHSCHPSTGGQTEARGWSQVPDQPGLHDEPLSQQTKMNKKKTLRPLLFWVCASTSLKSQLPVATTNNSHHCLHRLLLGQRLGKKKEIKWLSSKFLLSWNYTHTHSYTQIWIRTCTHMCTYMHIHTYIYIYKHKHVHTHIHKYTFTYTHVHACTHMHIYTQAHINTHMCTCTNTYTCTCLHPCLFRCHDKLCFYKTLPFEAWFMIAWFKQNEK